MGKRKRASDHTTDDTPCSSGMTCLSKQKSANVVDTGARQPLSSTIDIADSSAKLPSSETSLTHNHCNLTRAMFTRRSRQNYTHQYSRRNSAKNANKSLSRGKTFPICDEKVSSKLGSHGNPGSGHHAECREKKPFSKPERIISSSSASNAIPIDFSKMVCGICEKLLRRKPYIFGINGLTSQEVSVVAVLACGHVYHADCLEQRTVYENRRDPPCLSCAGVDAGKQCY